ncbi:hypothetical protein [Sphingomonas sp. GB1N7]|uniref:hypothetical protein n=1 Tax=Parasphingomonas caseinilytica TaxID=3096158 RepID=UPI002FC8354F
MASGTAAAKKPNAIGPAPIEFEARSLSYGGLVGQMIGEIDSRMAAQQAPVFIAESPSDVFHTISVACGYIGLLAGFVAAGTGIFLLL